MPFDVRPHVTRQLGADVGVAIVLREGVDVVEDVAVERAEPGAYLAEPRVHEGPLVEHLRLALSTKDIPCT